MYVDGITNRNDYWKRYYDDERRNKVKSKRPIPLVRKSKSIPDREAESLKNEVRTYKNLYLKEHEERLTVIGTLAKERQKSRAYFLQLQEIKKCLLKGKYV